MVVRLCLLSIANIGAGFALATALGRRYRKIAARQTLGIADDQLAAGRAAAGRGRSGRRDWRLPPAASRPPTGPRAQESRATWRSTTCRAHVADFGDKLIEADERLRQCAASPDLGTIETVLSDIENTARNFAESRDSAQQRAGRPDPRRGRLGRHQQRAGRGRADAGRRDQGHLPGDRQLRLRERPRRRMPEDRRLHAPPAELQRHAQRRPAEGDGRGRAAGEPPARRGRSQRPAHRLHQSRRHRARPRAPGGPASPTTPGCAWP